MKKLIKKLKKSNVFKKITVFSVITMILISSLTVSSFAADEEASAANEEVNSITDTWTSILNWITGSFSSVQNVFINSSDESTGVVSFTFFGNNGSSNLYFVNGLDFVPFDGQTIYIYNPIDSSDSFSFILESAPNDPSSFVSRSDSSSYFAELIYDSSDGWGLATDYPIDFSVLSFNYSASGYSSLTFLGTLSVVGVAIAVILLLISVIINFLKLKG